MLPQTREEWTKKVYPELHELRETSNAIGDLIIQSKDTREKIPMFHDFLHRWLDYKYKLATKQALGKKTIEHIKKLIEYSKKTLPYPQQYHSNNL